MVYFITLLFSVIRIPIALDESSFYEIPNAKRALPFVIAYRKKGAQGGEKVSQILNRTSHDRGIRLFTWCVLSLTDKRVEEMGGLALHSKIDVES